MTHGANRHDPADLDPEFARTMAEAMQALATPSRLRILGRLHAGPCTVTDLAEAVQMEPSAVSHQLRLLRHLRLAAGMRTGRHVVYELYDEHVGQLLEQAISHTEHLHLGREREGRPAEVARA